MPMPQFSFRHFPALLLATVLIASATSVVEADAQELVVEIDGETHTIETPEGWDWTAPKGSAAGRMVIERNLAEGRHFDESLILPDRERPAIGLDIIYRGRNVLVLRDENSEIRGSQGFTNQRNWQDVLTQVYTLYPDQFDMVMALTTWQNQYAQGFYLPLGNDTRGIGYRHSVGVETFNQTRSELDGLVFMNDYRFYTGRGGDVFGRIVFLQEIGHRWGALIHYDDNGVERNDILGRDASHWSFYLHSQNSAMEGNSWRDNGDGTFTTATNAFSLGFSDLDLYLMGFKPPSEVEPFFLIDNPGPATDDYGRSAGPASPPIFRRTVTLTGTRKDITIDDVIAAEGERSPSYENSQKVWRVATVLVVDGNLSFSESHLAEVERLLDSWETMFESATENQADLVFELEDVDVGGEKELGEICATSIECNPDDAPTCVDVGVYNVCSKRCSSVGSCGEGFCCQDDFCTPTFACNESGAEGEGEVEGGEGEAEGEGEGEGEVTNPFTEPDGVFTEDNDPFADEGLFADGSSSGSKGGGCQVAPGTDGAPLAAVFVLLAALGMVRVVRRQ